MNSRTLKLLVISMLFLAALIAVPMLLAQTAHNTAATNMKVKLLGDPVGGGVPCIPKPLGDPVGGGVPNALNSSQAI
jgi:hypothetical protein